MDLAPLVIFLAVIYHYLFFLHDPGDSIAYFLLSSRRRPHCTVKVEKRMLVLKKRRWVFFII